MYTITKNVNAFSQNKLEEEVLISQFKEIPIDDKRRELDLICLIQNTRPTIEEIRKGLTETNIKLTFTPAVILEKFEWNISKKKIKELPDSEIEKSFEFLINIFKICDTRRRNTDCIKGCNHNWHNE